MSGKSTFSRALAEWVRSVRGEESQRSFASRTGIAQSTISSMEQGDRGVRANHVDAILEALRMDASLFCRMLSEICRRIEAEDQLEAQRSTEARLRGLEHPASK